MQDRYVGDVGDFAKYALLRKLSSFDATEKIKLGVLWCRYNDESHNLDGKHTSYLRSSLFRDLDPELFDALNSIVSTNSRSLKSVMDSNIFHPGTKFFSAPISPPASLRLSRSERLAHRQKWLEQSLKLTIDCNLIFFDPDNGIEVASIGKDHPKAGKYVFWDEMSRHWERGKSLVIYHHLNRTMSAAKQIGAMKERMLREFSGSSIRSLLFRRGSCRVFWLISRSSFMNGALQSRADHFRSGGWEGHFSIDHI